MKKTPIIALTLGDPGGIGPEVIVKTLRALKRPRRAVYTVVGTSSAFRLLKEKTGLGISFQPTTPENLKHLKPGAIAFLDVTDAALAVYLKSGLKSSIRSLPQPKPGRLDPVNAAIALAALEQAAALACEGTVHALVTAPLNKTAIRMILSGFHGHTEYLAQAAGSKKFAMMFVSPRLKVTLVTIHVALKDVSRRITRDLVFEKISLTHEFFKQRMGIARPRLGVCALNPHGRETGEEEDLVLVPAVAAARRQGIRVDGPVSADRIFYDAYQGVYDGLISMYHDQALTAFKMIAFQEGVNTTLGLPFIRTSPDHGTAFDIAYQGKADASSMQASLRLAEQLIKSRQSSVVSRQ